MLRSNGDLDVWKVESITGLRRYKSKVRFLRFVEIVYHTGVPLISLFFLIQTNNILLWLPIIFVLFVRFKVR